jgi:uncharacterized protein YndB with AHSA1/START domain
VAIAFSAKLVFLPIIKHQAIQIKQLKGGATMTDNEFLAPPGTSEVIIKSTFCAPPAKVFKAMIDPAQIPAWWGLERLSTKVKKMDVRKGGEWRFIQCDGDGNEYAFRGKYHKVLPARELTFSSEYEGRPGRVSLETMKFEGRDGKTELTDSMVFKSVEDRDAMVHEGMKDGAFASIDRLEKLVGC